MKQLILFLLILLTSSLLFGNSKKGETLYFWETSSGLSWKGFGDKKFHPKYQGDVVRSKPNGLGILKYPWGAMYYGEWKDGRLWNGIGYDKKDNIIGKYSNGKNMIKKTMIVVEKEPLVTTKKEPLVTVEKRRTGILFRRLINGEFRWYEESDDDKDAKYVGEIKNGLAHGQGTYISPDGDKYVGNFKDGEYDGQGTYSFHDGAKYVGKFKDGKVWEGTLYNRDFKYKIVNGK